MFWHLQYIHLFRPFLKYTPANSPLPSNVSPRKMCSTNAGAISKLMRLYKKTYNLRQICNIAVYMVHSACTIHLLNLPEKTARRDIIHGVKHLEEIAEDWLCARRTLAILSVLARKWGVELPEEAEAVLRHTDEKYGRFNTSDVPSPMSVASSAQTGQSSGFVDVNTAATTTTTQPPLQQQTMALQQHQHSTYSGVTSAPQTLQNVRPVADGAYVLQSTYAAAGSVPSPHRQPFSIDSATSTVDFATGNANSNSSLQQALRGSPLKRDLATATADASSGWPGDFEFGATGFPATTTAAAPNDTSAAVTTTSGRSPSLFAVDGHDWFLKDSVSWHQNFEPWSRTPSSEPWGTSSGAATGGSAGGGSGSGAASVAAATPPQQPQQQQQQQPKGVFMFGGRGVVGSGGGLVGGQGMQAPQSTGNANAPEYDAALDALASLDAMGIDAWGSLSHLE